MRKKIVLLSAGSVLICILMVAGILFIQQQKRNELPIRISVVDYADYNLLDLAKSADCIIEGTVSRVGSNVIENVGEMEEPFTRIKIKVNNVIKGDPSLKSLIYLEEGGYTSINRVIPTGFAMEKGLDVILFLNENGKAVGGSFQSAFPILDELVIIPEIEDIPESEKGLLKTADTREMKSKYTYIISGPEINVMDKDDFISIVKSYLE